MLCLQRPTDSIAIRCLFGQRRLPFSYRETGGTRWPEAPTGYHVDRHRVQLGRGRKTFERAKAAMRAWQMFPPELAHVFWPDIPIRSGAAVGIAFRMGWIWSLNPCRIVYTVDESSGEQPESVKRFGFAYGTLPAHAVRGEERFTVEWHSADDSVWYCQAAFSRPEHWWGYLAYPWVRQKQRLFRHLSAQSMRRAVREACPQETVATQVQEAHIPSPLLGPTSPSTAHLSR